MDECQRKVENVFGSLQNDWIVIRSVMLWKEPAYSFIIFCVLNIISSCHTTGFFRYFVWCIVLCVLLLYLSLKVLLKTKLHAAIQIGKTIAEQKKRYEEETLSYQRFCSVIAPVLKFVEPSWEVLKKLVYTRLFYFLQINFLISVPMGGLLILLSLFGLIRLIAIQLWFFSLCSLWMPWQYYGITNIINEMLGTFPLPPHPYICSNHLMGQCQAVNCSLRHLKKPYQWMYRLGGEWGMMIDYDNDNLETCFCIDIMGETHTLELLDRVTFGNSTFHYVNFSSMTISGEFCQVPIKRLSTKSRAELPGCPVATKWCWYWKNEHGNFVEYQFNRIDASQELEKQYIRGETSFGFNVGQQKYELYFKRSPMCQKNMYFHTEREVRRRPCLNESARLTFWKIMEKKKEKKQKGIEDTQVNMRVRLEKLQKEYRNIEALFTKTMNKTHNIESIERLENQSVWEKYSSTKSQMSRGASDANERFLFHGTKKGSVEGICKKNFDWRKSGTSTGSLYGEGTYFATEASHSHHYTCADLNGSRYMFIALVLVGSYTQGNQGLRIPPPKDNDPHGDSFDSCVDNVENPKMVVIFDKDQCYPAYLVKYSA
ncbi:protein mono-ADP-ribosyltransferase PARP12-like [Actinia tenebrosa]|uniref:Poly [ADP-ribose] polymerase n=1 Tax=Actinia tenebrosa TaxID=6105 RepID=A0A6P8I690_ACTTE|nr:protein mono-ADP-ribosyltransferase PARP12-like [Actinia tenebrosa]